MPRHTLISDFDGTLAAVDFYAVARQHLIPPGAPDLFADHLAGSLSHFDCLAQTYARIDKPEAEVVARVREMRVEPGLPGLVRQLDAAGWDLVVASAGCRWYIDILLDGLAVEVHANGGAFEAGRGLVMTRELGSPYYCERVGTDKPAIVRAALARGGRVAYAGDGFTDAPALKLVEPHLRFARADAAAALDAEGLAYRGFARWAEVVEGVLGVGEATPPPGPLAEVKSG